MNLKQAEFEHKGGNMNKELEKRIEEYLKTHSFCSLATIEGNRPNASTVEYVNRGIEIIIVSFMNSQKVKNLVKNPRVALTINSEKYPSRDYHGLQYYGKAELVADEKEIFDIKSLFFDKYMTKETRHWNKEKVGFYVIKPERIDMIDYRAKFGHKDTWLPA